MATRSESALCSLNENLELSGMNNGSSVHNTINIGEASPVVEDGTLYASELPPVDRGRHACKCLVGGSNHCG